MAEQLQHHQAVHAPAQLDEQRERPRRQRRGAAVVVVLEGSGGGGGVIEASGSPPGGSGTAASWAGVQPSKRTSANGAASRQAASPVPAAGSGAIPGTGVPNSSRNAERLARAQVRNAQVAASRRARPVRRHRRTAGRARRRGRLHGAGPAADLAALRGRPLLAPDAPTLAALTAIVVGTAVAVTGAARASTRRRAAAERPTATV
ncbi:hypothetical protein [Pseudonocardia humida]|uniref:hypothetical protein n=1 Tax=Pseudonocardia humida TaxID=2800819 RepID=UPI00207C8767|nr:hypothetical protein [Pseudonocardia humida]